VRILEENTDIPGLLKAEIPEDILSTVQSSMPDWKIDPVRQYKVPDTRKKAKGAE
jgi:hypothetical protein